MAGRDGDTTRASLRRLLLLAVGALLPVLARSAAMAQTSDGLTPQHHTVSSPEWLRLCSAICSTHPYPGVYATNFLRFYTDPYRIDGENPLWRRTFGGDFEFVFPYQGLPGVMYWPAGWMAPKVGEVNSVTAINYQGIQRAANMLHRKGAWLGLHVPGAQWWGASSETELPSEGALYMNMQLLGLQPPPDGFYFDATLEQGTDVDAIRRRAEEVLPGGHYIMFCETGADLPGFNTHFCYLSGPRPKAWADGLHGVHYIWFAIRGLQAHDVSREWGRRLLLLTAWDCLFWGGASGNMDLPPSHYYDRARMQEFVALTRLLWEHGDLLGLVKSPARLPKEDLCQDGFAVNVFDGAAPAYFRTPDGPSADKRIYAFKTGGAPAPFGDPTYYETMPPVPDEGPRGDLFRLRDEPGYHFVSAGIDGTRRTPTRREGDNVIIATREPLARYGTFPAPGETIYVIRYRNVLSIGRGDGLILNVAVNKPYAENLIVEAELLRDGSDRHVAVVSRPVINQEVSLDMADAFGINDLRPTDEIRIRLLREHPLDRWHVPYFVCDEVILSGRELELRAAVRNCPTTEIARGSAVGLDAEISNAGTRARTAEITWQLPAGWSVEQGDVKQNVEIAAGGVAPASIRVRVGDNAVFGGQKIRLVANSGETGDGIETNRGFDSRMVMVGPGEVWQGNTDREQVSIETGGFRGMADVTIPISHYVAHRGAGSFKVVEYDAAGRAVNDVIAADFTRIGENGGLLNWMVTGNDAPYRNFYVHTTNDAAPQASSASLLSAHNLVIPEGQALVSTVKHKYGILEMRASFSYPTANDTWVGFLNPLPDGWSVRRFDPHTPQSLIAWNVRSRDDAHPLIAVFDNGSGMVELSSGKKLDVKDFGTVNCDEVWGDYGWPEGNQRLDRANPFHTQHTYRIEWQRLYQRWYIDGQLVYERQIALDDPLPLVIANHTKDVFVVVSLRMASPYSRSLPPQPNAR